MKVKDGSGKSRETALPLPNHASCLPELFAVLKESGAEITGIGHRVVHGGMDHAEPEAITPALLAALRSLTAIDPDHMPQAISAIEALGGLYPSLPQVACFDTAFHRHMPPVAQRYPLPREFSDAGIVRYGFHGLSYEYIVQELRSLDQGAGQKGSLALTPR